jgi:nucleoid-associated protein YgaU
MQKDRNAQFMVAEVEEVMMAYGGQPPADAKPVEEGKYVEEKQEEVESPVKVNTKEYVIQKDDSLWRIAKYKDIYNDPFLWPVIYEANKDIIKNPKLLYPGQELGIPRGGYLPEEIKNTRKKAGAAKPYLPPQQANLPVD